MKEGSTDVDDIVVINTSMYVCKYIVREFISDMGSLYCSKIQVKWKVRSFFISIIALTL